MLSSTFAARGLPLKPDPNIVLLDHAAEWIEFLRSPKARALRFDTLRASLAEPFRMETHIVPVQKVSS